MQKLNSVKGTKDIFGKTVLEHDHVIKTFKDICVFNNFKKISTPILEHENIFVKTLGVSSDIISNVSRFSMPPLITILTIVTTSKTSVEKSPLISAAHTSWLLGTILSVIILTIITLLMNFSIFIFWKY